MDLDLFHQHFHAQCRKCSRWERGTTALLSVGEQGAGYTGPRTRRVTELGKAASHMNDVCQRQESGVAWIRMRNQNSEGREWGWEWQRECEVGAGRWKLGAGVGISVDAEWDRELTRRGEGIYRVARSQTPMGIPLHESRDHE